MFHGKKNWIVAIVVAIAGLVKLITGVDLTDWIAMLFTSIGWGDQLGNPEVELASQVALTAFALYAAVKGLLKFIKEKKAGASAKEALTQVGAVKLAIAEGVIPPVEIQPKALAIPPTTTVLESAKVINKDVEKKA